MGNAHENRLKMERTEQIHNILLPFNYVVGIFILGDRMRADRENFLLNKIKT